MTTSSRRVLLIYPTLYRVTGLPVGLASLNAVLRGNGFETRIFETAFYPAGPEKSQDDARAERMMSKPIRNESEHHFDNTSDMCRDLLDRITEFSPSIVGISLLEATYHIGLRLTRAIKDHFPGLFVVAGGVLPTLSPEVVLEESSIDAICIGEGESVFLDLCKRIAEDMGPTPMPGITYRNGKDNGRMKPAHLHDLSALPHPDFEGFDPRLFYKPMQGRLYKMANIETSRGCPYMCTYCGAPMLRDTFKHSSCGRYYRTLPMELVFKQLNYQIEKHDPEFIYFSSETFLAISDDEFSLFVNAYAKIGLPFWFQTRFETITEDRLKALKDVGLHWMTLGVEHGNEAFRKKVLKRFYSNDLIIKAVEIMAKLGLGASLNNLIGLPFETRELVFDTIKLNRMLYQINNRVESNVFMFTPYRGCELYEVCKREGLLTDGLYTDSTDVQDETVLLFPQQWREELKGLAKTFNLYVRLPDEHYPLVHRAEKATPDGERVFRDLCRALESS